MEILTALSFGVGDVCAGDVLVGNTLFGAAQVQSTALRRGVCLGFARNTDEDHGCNHGMDTYDVYLRPAFYITSVCFQAITVPALHPI